MALQDENTSSNLDVSRVPSTPSAPTPPPLPHVQRTALRETARHTAQGSGEAGILLLTAPLEWMEMGTLTEGRTPRGPKQTSHGTKMTTLGSDVPHLPVFQDPAAPVACCGRRGGTPGARADSVSIEVEPPYHPKSPCPLK